MGEGNLRKVKGEECVCGGGGGGGWNERGREGGREDKTRPREMRPIGQYVKERHGRKEEKPDNCEIKS